MVKKEHIEQTTQYPDKYHDRNQAQKYFFHGEQLRYLRPGQLFRYFSHGSEEAPGRAPTLRTEENTMADLDDHRVVPDDPRHRRYAERVSALTPGIILRAPA